MQVQAYLQGAVSPRPIALASTIDQNGSINLSPFSFYNLFSSNPPILIFSPSRRVRDNTTKHTLDNVQEVPEVVINAVTYEMVQQTSLSSTEYARGVNEFEKAGFSPVKSSIVSPPRVKESPVAFECKVNQVIPLGQQGGAGNLVVCEVLLIHLDERVLNNAGVIDPNKIDTVARMGGDWYCRASGDAIFKVPKPLTTLGIGVDQLPSPIRNSPWLSGNDLGMLGNIERMPTIEEAEATRKDPVVMKALNGGQQSTHLLAKQYLQEQRIAEAWMILLASL